MLTKSITAKRQASDLRETFDVLRKYKMKLNLKKCVFRVPSRRFLRFQVHQRGIEVNPDKIQALADLKSPRMLKIHKGWPNAWHRWTGSLADRHINDGAGSNKFYCRIHWTRRWSNKNDWRGDKKACQWQLHVDSSSNTYGSRARIVVSTLERDLVKCVLHFYFKATNN